MTGAAEICSALVARPSVSGPGAEVACAELLEPLLARAGFACSVAGVPGRPNLLARLAAPEPGPTLLLTGHLDVVAEGRADEWEQPPFSGAIAGGELWGRGSVDMKGAVAAIVAAALRTRPRTGELLLAFTADEEGEGRWGIPWLLAEGLIEADAAVVGEPSGTGADFERIALATRGFALAFVEITGPGGHSSIYDPARPHPVAAAASLIGALESEFRPAPAAHWAFPDGPTVVAGASIEAGDHWGVLPRSARIGVEARPLPGADRAAYQGELRAFVRARVPDALGVSVELDAGGWGDPGDLDRSHPLAAAALAAVRKRYPAAEAGGFVAYSEGAQLAAAGIPTIPALGPGRLDRAHLPDERVAVAALEAATAIYADLIDGLLGPDSPLR